MNPKTSKNSFFNLPSVELLPELNQSLKMINTINVFPQHCSFENMELAVVGTGTGEAGGEGGEDSLGERISHVATAANSARKKRVGCNCKKTFCLKLYCECFSSGRDCGDDCACLGCKNTKEYKGEVEIAKAAAKERGLRNCSLSDRRCTCKKTGCLKRYCECFNAGVGCSEACKCEGCKNIDLSQPQEEEEPQPSEEQAVQRKGQLGLAFPSLKKCGSLDDFQKYYD